MVKNNSNLRIFTLNCGGQLLTTEKPLLMGILNTTPDSFFSDSRVSGPEQLIQQAARMLEQGADILDIGGQSTRPSGSLITAAEEWERVAEPIRLLHSHFPKAILSIDTFYASVARNAVETGVTIINDISGGQFDPDMLTTAGHLQVPYICMHIPGSINNMHELPQYKQVTRDVLDYFIQKKEACERAGIRDLVIDPGFGFGKTMEQNFELLQQLDLLQLTGLPILAGVSRKSMIWKTLGITPAEALNGTTVLHTAALLAGVSILRVHDVREAREAITLVDAIKKSAPVNQGRID